MRTPRFLSAVLAVVLLIGLLAGGPPGLETAAAREVSDAEGIFLFTRLTSGAYRQVGDDETRFSYAQGDHVRPRLLSHPDRFVLNSNRGERPGIWLATLDGGLGERLCDGDQVCVSADGRFLAFRRQGAIIRRELAWGTETVLSPAGWTSCSCPSFCPDGRVLFLSENAGKTTVCRADPQKPGAAETLFAAEAKSAPRCSPDGQVIACQDGAHISLFDPQTGSRRRLTLAAGVQSWPMWSRDGRSVAYLQSPEPLDGPWHVYRLALDDPTHVMLILRDVQVSPDWNGLGFSDGDTTEVPGDRVRLWHTDRPLASSATATTLPTPAGGWTEGVGRTAGDVLVECEWGGLYLSAATGKLLLGQRQADDVAATAELRLLDAQDREAQRIVSTDVSPPTPDEVLLSITCSADDGSSLAVAVSVSRVWPFVQVQPADPQAGLLVRRTLALAVVPDRLAHDLVYQPSDYGQPSVPLPRAPFLLGMSAGMPGLLMVATPHATQTTELLQGADAQAFAGLRVRCEGEAALVSFLPGDDLWRRLHVARPEEREGWDVVWSNPFPALWRAAVPVPEAPLSLMVRTATPNTEQRIALDEARRLKTTPPQAIAYPYGPSENAPLDRAMPVDILYEALGLDRTAALLDTEGIRTYRHADEWVPYKDPRVALKMISWLRQRKRPGVQERIDGLCRDITLTLQGLDVRLNQYASFVGQVRDSSAAPDAPADLSSWTKQQLSTLDAVLGAQAVTPLADVTAKIEAFRTNLGAPHDAFAAPVTRAFAERQVHLAAYRAFAKGLRDQAGRTLAQSPDSRPACEALRDLAGQALRQRYYLEDDWLGEEPLGGPEVSYEQIKDL